MTVKQMSARNQLLDPIGMIRDDATYTRELAMIHTGWGAKSWASARRDGMKVLRKGSRLYVSGAELNRYLRTLEVEG